jgi:peptidoglycan hydrolase-like protein with peptidoglycan-binding domain
MKKYLFLFLLILTTGSVLRADDQLRAAQQSLKEQGFYYGEADGQPGPETSAAIRRFQIRNGLEVTGTLTPATLSSLNGGEPPQPSANPEPRAPAAVVESDKDFLEPGTKREMPQGALPAPTDAATPDSGRYGELFAKTPYESAPPEVQRSTVRRAQVKLARSGYYRAEPDGFPSREMSRAIAEYQIDKGIPRTGRLDMRTLSELDLLPVLKRAPRPPIVEDDPIPGKRIYRGIWVH